MKTIKSDYILLNWKSTGQKEKGQRLSSKTFKSILKVCDEFLKDEMKIKKRGISELELNLSLCGAYKIKKLNSSFRDKDKVTDVLSFPVHESVRKLKSWVGPLELGDLFICREVAKRQALNFKITYTQEVIHLFVHGLLHLLGFDHEVSAKEEKIMLEHEENLVRRVYQELKQGS